MCKNHENEAPRVLSRRDLFGPGNPTLRSLCRYQKSFVGCRMETSTSPPFDAAQERAVDEEQNQP
jgi:hypothetical protein